MAGESRRQVQVSEMIAHLAGDFLARESNRQSLMTVTHADISPDFKNAMIYISVMPASMEETALAFAKRERSAFREYIKKHAKFHPIPTVDFELDYGEKNRQRIDDLTR